MLSSRLLEIFVSAKSDQIKAELRATALSIGNTIPQFIEDDDQLDLLIEHIEQFRSDIMVDKPREESLIMIDGFLDALRNA